MEVVGVVMALFDECFDLLLIKYGIVKRIYLKVYFSFIFFIKKNFFSFRNKNF